MRLDQFGEQTQGIVAHLKARQEGGEGADIRATYYPYRVTGKLARANRLRVQAGEGIEANADFLAAVLKSWDLEESEGVMFPLDAERLVEIPLLISEGVVTAVLQDLYPERFAGTS